MNKEINEPAKDIQPKPNLLRMLMAEFTIAAFALPVLACPFVEAFSQYARALRTGNPPLIP